MTNTELGACEQFIYELRRSNLIERGQLEQVIEDFLRRQPQAEPERLAKHLVSQGVLTQFQAERVLQGKTQGLVLGPYVLVDGVGQGSMGVVHKAQSKTDNKWYAVKVLPRRSMWNVRLARRQVRAFGQFQHAAVVPFVDVGTAGGQHYLVWPFVDGETLDAIVQKNGKLEPGVSAQIALEIATGLNIAHQNSLFHGLLKPSNVMIGAGQQVYILDFGIGSLLAENEGESLVDTMSTANALTSGLDCCCPESIMEPTNRTPAGDQYSLGCVLYYMLSGRYPFPEGSAVEKMMAHQFKQPAPLAQLVPEASPELIAIVERLMMKKAEERYPGVDEAVEALQPLAAQALAERTPRSLPRSALPPGSLPRSALPTPGSVPRSALPTPGSVPRSALPTPGSVPRSALPTPGSVPRSALPTPGSVPRSALPVPPKSARPSASGLAAMASAAQVEPAFDPVPPPSSRLLRREAGPASGIAPPVARLAPTQPAPFQAAPQYYIEPAEESRPALGPLGFLAIGAAVALVCFLLMNSFLK